MAALKLNTSYRHHIIVAALIGIWLVLFLVLIAPFDTSDLSFSIRLTILPPYGIIAFVGYLVLIPLQNWIYKLKDSWNISSEITFIVLYNIVVCIGSYSYYKTEIINGTYGFAKFALQVYYPIFFIILPFLLFLRWWLNKKSTVQHQDLIRITGENKLDLLQINPSDLICISSADNYVELFYLNKGELTKKLLRITLKNIHPQVPNLLKVHRSHLINPLHFKDWKNANTLNLSHLEVPVSKNYKKEVLSVLGHSSLKTNNSPQTQ